MSALAAAAERFADGRHVLVGDAQQTTVAVAARTVNADRLDRLRDLGGGPVVLGLTDAALGRLGLLLPAGRGTTSLTAVGARADRARSMRAAAEAETVLTPGHVDVVRLDATPGGVAAAQLATLAGTGGAVALCAVVGADGLGVPLPTARRRADLAHLPSVSVAELGAAVRVEPARAAA